MNTYYKILNEIASVFNMDQWDDQVNTFTDAIDKQLNSFAHNTKYDEIYILENSYPHDFPQFNFYKERCYINGKKVKLMIESGRHVYGSIKNKWKDRETIYVTIEDLDQLEKSCTYMFYGCLSLVSVPLFNTNKVTHMTRMFKFCESLKSVPKFDTSRVTNMDAMFYKCKSLKSVPLFDTSRVAGMERMFQGCPSLSEETKQNWSSVYDFKNRCQMK